MPDKVELITDPSLINEIYSFIRAQNLDYPNYDQWAKKCYDELLLNQKKAFGLIKKIDGKPVIVGNIIVQTHKSDPSVLELKNGRVDPLYRKKGWFKFIYREVEKYAIENGYKRIIADAHIDADDVIGAMKRSGFKIEAKENLYGSKSIEAVLVKDLNRNRIILLAAHDITSLLIKLGAILKKTVLFYHADGTSRDNAEILGSYRKNIIQKENNRVQMVLFEICSLEQDKSR